jgi:hypothetical protein
MLPTEPSTLMEIPWMLAVSWLRLRVDWQLMGSREACEPLITRHHRHALFEIQYSVSLHLYLEEVSDRNHPTTQTPEQQARSHRQTPLQYYHKQQAFERGIEVLLPRLG